LRDARYRDDVVLDIDRRDPFATALDEVFGAIGDDQVLLRIDLRDVTGHQPAVVKLFRLWIGVVLRRDPRAADQQLADGFSVVRKRLEMLVDDLDLETGKRKPGLGGVGELLVERKLALRALGDLAR